MEDSHLAALSALLLAADLASSAASASLPATLAAVRAAAAPAAAPAPAAPAEGSATLELALRSLVLQHLRGCSSSSSSSSAPAPAPAHPFVDNVLDLCLLAVGGEPRLLEPAALFAVLEDVAEASPVGGLEAIWRVVEDRRLQLHPLVQGQRARLALLRVASGLLRRLSRASDTVMCGKILLFLAFILPLSERSGVNVTGSFNVDNAAAYEGAAEDAAEVLEPCAAWRGGRAPPLQQPAAKAAVAKAGGGGAGAAQPQQPAAAAAAAAAAPADPPFCLGGRFHVPAAASSLQEAYRAAASGAAAASTAFYRTFWRMQSLLYHPATVLATSDTWALYVCGMRVVLRAFEREDVDSGLAVNLGTSVPAAAAAMAAAAPAAGAPGAGAVGAGAAQSLEDGEEMGSGGGGRAGAAAAPRPAPGAAAGRPASAAASAALQAAKAAAAKGAAAAPPAAAAASSSSASAAAPSATSPVVPTLHLITRSALDAPLPPSASSASASASSSSSARRQRGSGEGAMSDGEGAEPAASEDLFGDKYLTSPTLLTLELKDASLRRHVILQFLISMHYLLQPRKAGAGATPGAPAAGGAAGLAAAAAAAAILVQQQPPSAVTLQRDLAPLQTACYALLRRCPPSGQRFARVIQSLLARESHLHAWKLAGAHPFEKPLPAPAAPGAEGAGEAGASPAKRPRTSLSGLMASRMVYPNIAASASASSSSGGGGASKRPLAWASAGLDCDLLSVCSNPARAVRPTLAAFLVPLRLAIDPSQGIEAEFSPANDGLYVWRGLRLLAEEKLEALFSIAVGKNSFTEAIVEAFEIRLPAAAGEGAGAAGAGGAEGGEGGAGAAAAGEAAAAPAAASAAAAAEPAAGVAGQAGDAVGSGAPPAAAAEEMS